MNLTSISAAVLTLVLLGSTVGLEAQQISTREILELAPRAADHRLVYGSSPSSFGDLRLPVGKGPHPVIVLLHGGCWRDFVSLQYLDSLAEALTELGIATWNVEYRRVDSPDTAWPATFEDVAQATDFLRTIAPEYDLDLSRVLVPGHSAGGHLATWLAARPRVPRTSALSSANPLPIAGVVTLAGPADLEMFRTGDDQACGGEVVDRLMGGTPSEVPDHYAAGSPSRLLPIGVPQRLITGADDRIVPARYAESYAERARAAGDDVVVITVPNAAHFEPVSPWSSVRSDAWLVVARAVVELLREAGGRVSTP